MRWLAPLLSGVRLKDGLERHNPPRMQETTAILAYTLKESVEIAYKNRPDLLSMQATQDAVKEALNYTKRSYLPDLTGSVGYNWNNNTH